MDGPFRINLSGVNVELGGNTVILDNDNLPEDVHGEFLDYFKCKDRISHAENYVVLGGHPENGVLVEVLEHVFRDDMMITVHPFFTKNGISKFVSKNDLYVVFSRDGEHRIYVVCHRDFSTGIIMWDARMRRKLPAQKSEGKPLTAHPELPAEIAGPDPEDVAGRQAADRRNFVS